MLLTCRRPFRSEKRAPVTHLSRRQSSASRSAKIYCQAPRRILACAEAGNRRRIGRSRSARRNASMRIRIAHAGIRRLDVFQPHLHHGSAARHVRSRTASSRIRAPRSSRQFADVNTRKPRYNWRKQTDGRRRPCGIRRGEGYPRMSFCSNPLSVRRSAADSAAVYSRSWRGMIVETLRSMRLPFGVMYSAKRRLS